MTGYTPLFNFPYPEQSTLITDSAAIVQSLAEAVEAVLPTVSAGTIEPSTAAYTVAPYEIARLEVSQTWVAPDVNGDNTPFVCDILIITGGGHQAFDPGAATVSGSHGGSGGRAGLWKSVKLQPGQGFDVVIGGTLTGSSFESLSLTYGAGPNEPQPYGAARPGTANNNAIAYYGNPGCQITPLGGTTFGVCGGGSSGPGGGGGSSEATDGLPGVDGGGASGMNGYGSTTYKNRCQGGVMGTLGGGAGGRGGGGSGTTHIHNSPGSRGAVIVFAYQEVV